MTGLFTCCVVVQKEMQALYNHIPDKFTGGVLLTWAVSTYMELPDGVDGRVISGIHHCCRAAPEAGRAGVTLPAGYVTVPDGLVSLQEP